MQRKIITTADGSKTIFIPEWNEQYHSKHGAIQEANHVFIKSGLHHYLETNEKNDRISILEIGFGTGLNAFITLIESQKLQIRVNYTGIEAYPVSSQEIDALNYIEELSAGKFTEDFRKLHDTTWEEFNVINSSFNLLKRKQFISEIDDENLYHLIYFDAFGPRVQPELWKEAIFKSMYQALKDNGLLVTYSAKGSVRRAMQEVGFKVERLPGPPGKRHMLRALKV